MNKQIFNILMLGVLLANRPDPEAIKKSPVMVLPLSQATIRGLRFYSQYQPRANDRLSGPQRDCLRGWRLTDQPELFPEMQDKKGNMKFVLQLKTDSARLQVRWS